MELTPKVFRDVRFREKLRNGYHPEDVDEFLEQAALAAETLQERLRQLTERAQRAEQTANDATATDEALKRMLLMAQKTADQAVREAREEADRALSEAKRQAALIVADAEERGRRTYESAISEGRERMADLERSVARRQQEVEALQGWVEMEKGRLVRLLHDAQEAVANAGFVSEPPQVPPAEVLAGNAAHEAPTEVGDAPSRERPVPEGSAMAGTGPDAPGADSAAAERAPDDDTGEVVDISGGPVRQSQDPDWDPRYLDNVGAQHAVPSEDSSRVGPAGPGASPGQRTYYPSTAAPVPGQPGTAAHSQPGHSQSGHSPEDDETLAFDERALDSFFSEQELGDERGLGRFRRRS